MAVPAETNQSSSPIGFIQVDLDGLWTIRQCYHDEVEDSFENDPVFMQGGQNFLNLLNKKGIKATFFVTGKDVTRPEKREILKRLLEDGHYIANHSNTHRIGLSRLPEKQIESEIHQAQVLLEQAFGIKPCGFRSPGYDLSHKLLKVVGRLGFKYDSSLLPTFWGSPLRLVSMYISKQLRPRSQFGRFTAGFAPLRPYKLREKEASASASPSGLWEIPVSVSPWLRLPFHCSVVISLGLGYFKRIINSLLMKNLPINYVFHSIDLADTGGVRVLTHNRAKRFFHQPFEKKLKVVEAILDLLGQHFALTTGEDWLNRRD